MAAKIITAEPVVKMDPTVNTINGNVAFTLTVGTEEALYVEFNGVNAAGQVSSKNNMIYGALSTAVIGTIAPASFRTALSGVTAASLQAEIAGEVKTYVATLNALLAAGIKYPTIFNIEISGLDMECNKGFINAGIDVTPAGFETLAAHMHSIAEEMRYIRRLNRIEEINQDYYAARAQVV